MKKFQDYQIVKHVKRGTVYRIIGEAGVQTSRPIVEGDRVVVYRSNEPGAEITIRLVEEFEDGRFEAHGTKGPL